MHWFIHMVRYALVHWGYLALGAGLLGEDAGIPLPGETILMLASFLSHKSSGLSLWAIILVGIVAAVAGDNIGFWLGRRLGRRFIGWLRKTFHLGDDIEVARDQIDQHGRATVFWARYIFGLRTIAGPVAGALGMDWRDFFIYNALGAVSWVLSISLIAWAFSSQFHSLLGFVEKCSWGIAGAVFSVGYVIWRRKKKDYRERQRTGQLKSEESQPAA